MIKFVAIVVATLAVSTAAGVAARLTLMPPAKPAAAADSALAAAHPVAGAGAREHGTEPAAPAAPASAVSGVETPASPPAPAEVAAPTESPERREAMTEGMGVSPPRQALAVPAATGKKIRPPADAVEFTQLAAIVAKMNASEASVLLAHLDDAQVLAILRDMTIADAATILANLPPSRASAIKAKLLDPVGR